jgi:transcriptional regulator with XRE-family HTH domain
MVKTLGQTIRDLRERKDLSVRELAKKVDISPAFLSDLELGRRHPSDDTLARIAQVLGTPAAGLRALDTRPAVDEIRRLAASDPAYGFAFRQLVDMQLSAEELLKLVTKKANVSRQKK